jgi:hypothetical protein
MDAYLRGVISKLRSASRINKETRRSTGCISGNVRSHFRKSYYVCELKSLKKISAWTQILTGLDRWLWGLIWGLKPNWWLFSI